MKPTTLPGPPHLIEAAKAEAYREILEGLTESHPELIEEIVQRMAEDHPEAVEETLGVEVQQNVRDDGKRLGS